MEYPFLVSVPFIDVASEAPTKHSADMPCINDRMDTLVIPMQDNDRAKAIRKRGIQQIFTVFKESENTLVLDAGLVTLLSAARRPASHAAMKVLSSSWMRRLWTLQEAFLSKRIYFAFHEDERSTNTHLLDTASGNVTSAIMAKFSSRLKHSIMDHERNNRDLFLFDRSDKLPPWRATRLVANTWRATRWRVRAPFRCSGRIELTLLKTTTNHFHEALALATLLGLDYENPHWRKRTTEGEA